MIEKEIEALAKAIATEAKGAAVALCDKTEALKTLVAYHAILLKYKQKHDPDEDEPNFGEFAKQIEEVTNVSSPKVRGRRGTGLAS